MWSKRVAVIALGLILAGCHNKRPATMVAVPPPTIVPVIIPVTAPVAVTMSIPVSLPVPPGTHLFEEAERAYAVGNYTEAIESYEYYLASIPNGEHTDQALFHAGMSYVLRTKPAADWTVATADLRRLVKELPNSPLVPTANLILSLRSRADQLSKDAKAGSDALHRLHAELERLKKIDADRVKRP